MKWFWIGKYVVVIRPKQRDAFPCDRFYRIGKYIMSGIVNTRLVCIGKVYDTF